MDPVIRPQNARIEYGQPGSRHGEDEAPGVQPRQAARHAASGPAGVSVAILCPPFVQSLDITGPIEVFREAARQAGDANFYDLCIVGVSADAIIGSGALRILPDRTVADFDGPIDTLLVAGHSDLNVHPMVRAWLMQHGCRFRRCGSLRAGIFALAASGLLDHQHAAVHWEYAQRLAADYPNVIVDSNSIFVRDGNICTCAGATASLDLALAWVEEDLGRALALAVARRLLLFLKRPGGQSQVSAHLAAQLSARPAIQKIQDLILDDLQADLSLRALARRAAMSPRNLSRLFRREMNTTPAAFVKAARVEAVRRMLEDTDMPLQRIAPRCGFGNVEALRRALVRSVGTLPREYRRRNRPAAHASPARSRNGISCNGPVAHRA